MGENALWSLKMIVQDSLPVTCSVCVLLGDAAAEGHCDGAEWRTDLLQVSERAICEKNAATHIKFSQVLRSTCQILHCHICHLR